MTCLAVTWLSAAAPCGTLVIPSAIGQDDPSSVTSLNPLIGNSTYNQQSGFLLYRPLIWVGQDGRADPDRSLAQSVAASEHDTRFVVTLKPWLWSDGQKISADDVVYTWDLIGKLGPAFAYYGQGGIPGRVASVRALDAAHVEFRLRTPSSPDWFSLAGLSIFPALPRHAWGDLSRDGLWQRQTDPALFSVVDGPFRLERFLPDRSISYVPNPLYGGHRAGVARLVIDFLEGGSALHALRAGDVDMAQVPLSLWDDVRTWPGTVPMMLPEPSGYLALTFNLQNDEVAFFRDARVRRALTDATDQKTMIDLVYHGASSENRVPIPTDTPLFRSQAVQAGTIPVRYDRALAEAELDAAGWSKGADGVRARGGVRLEFTIQFSSESAQRIQLLQVLQQDLRKVGVIVHIQPVSFNQLMAISGGPADGWDALLSSVTLASWPDGTSYFDKGGSSNSGGYSDMRMDQLIAASTAPSGMTALFAYQDLFAAEQPVNILPQGQVALLVSAKVRGLDAFVNKYGFLSPEYLSVSSSDCPDDAEPIR